MASWQARALAAFVRLTVRRDDWGPPRKLARSARRVFGPPRPWQWFMSRGSCIEQLMSPVRGEWISAPASRPSTVILYLHGGGYVSCSPGTHRPITTALARATEARIFSVDYRLAPEHPFPAALDDAYAAYQWLLGQGIPADHIAVAGDSAGGGLTLALCIRARDAGLPLPACTVCFSPWADLAGLGPTVNANAQHDSMFAPGNIKQFAVAVMGDASPRNPLASPVYADLHGLPPTLIQVGLEELLIDDARRVHDGMRVAGGECTLHIVDGVFHGWQLCTRLMPEADVSLREAADFIVNRIARH